MFLVLAPGISFCDADGRRIFLDLPNDRYFCLGPTADEAFGELVRGAVPSETHSASLHVLERSGILIRADTPLRPYPCRARPILASPLDTDALAPASPLSALGAAIGVARAKCDVRWRRLHRLCDGVRRAKLRIAGQSRSCDAAELARLASTFQASGRLVGALDQCLALSLALMRCALAHRIRADLYFGVRVRPFHAHAWVQVDDVVISDRVDVVRPFTPILVL